MALAWLAAAVLALCAARLCDARTFSEYVAAGLPQNSSVTGFWTFNDPLDPLADTSGNNNHITDELSQAVDLVNLTGGYGDTMALGLRNVNNTPNRFRISMALNSGYPTTMCFSVRLLKTDRSFVAFAASSGGGASIYSTPKYGTTSQQLGIARGSAVYVEQTTDLDGGCQYFVGPLLRWQPPGGRFVQVCAKFYNNSNGLLGMTLYYQGRVIGNRTACSGRTQYVGPSPFNGTNSSVYLGWRTDIYSSGGFAGLPVPIQFDEVAIWRSALSEAEVQTYFNISSASQPSITQGVNGSTSVPIAYYSFNSDFGNNITGSSLGSFGPIGYISGTSAVSPNPSPYNFSSTMQRYGNASGANGMFVLGQNATFYTTSGAFGRSRVSVCYQFQPISATFTLPCLDTDFQPTVELAGPQPAPAPAGMVWIPGGEFSMGSKDPRGDICGGNEPMDDARPVHRVQVLPDIQVRVADVF